MRYKLTDMIPNVDDMTLIQVCGYECKYYGLATENITFEEVLKKAGFNFEIQMPTYIIVEHPLCGEIYQIGNAGDNDIWEHGNTKGYA